MQQVLCCLIGVNQHCFARPREFCKNKVTLMFDQLLNPDCLESHYIINYLSTDTVQCRTYFSKNVYQIQILIMLHLNRWNPSSETHQDNNVG